MNNCINNRGNRANNVAGQVNSSKKVPSVEDYLESAEKKLIQGRTDTAIAELICATTQLTLVLRMFINEVEGLMRELAFRDE